MIDAEHRVFREHGVQRAVQRTRRLEVVAKRLLDDDARAGRETDAPKTFRDGAEETRRNGEVAGWVGGSAKNLAQRVERGRVAIVAIDVSQHVDQTREVVVAHTAAMFVEARTRSGPELLERPPGLGHAYDRDREPTVSNQRLEGWEDLLVGKIARRAKENERIGWSGRHAAEYLSSILNTCPSDGPTFCTV